MATDEEVALLGGGGQGHLLVRLPPAHGSLASRLAAVAATGALNLRPLTAGALADVFLPAILPAAWRCCTCSALCHVAQQRGLSWWRNYVVVSQLPPRPHMPLFYLSLYIKRTWLYE